MVCKFLAEVSELVQTGPIEDNRDGRLRSQGANMSARKPSMDLVPIVALLPLWLDHQTSVIGSRICGRPLVGRATPATKARLLDQASDGSRTDGQS